MYTAMATVYHCVNCVMRQHHCSSHMGLVGTGCHLFSTIKKVTTRVIFFQMNIFDFALENALTRALILKLTLTLTLTLPRVIIFWYPSPRNLVYNDQRHFGNKWKPFAVRAIDKCFTFSNESLTLTNSNCSQRHTLEFRAVRNLLSFLRCHGRARTNPTGPEIYARKFICGSLTLPFISCAFRHSIP